MSDNFNSDSNDQHNQGGLWAFMGSMIFVFAFMFYLVAIHQGVNLDEKVVDPAQQAAAGPVFDIAKVTEPWVSTPEILEHGKKIYMQNCALCHGNEAKGDGPGGMGLNPRPRNFVEGAWKMGAGLTNFFKVITNGMPNTTMASFKQQVSVENRWAIAHFINSVTQNKSKETPEQVAQFAKSYKE